MLQTFQYKDHDINFTKADNTVYVNATEMAKPFGRVPSEYLKRGAVKEFVEKVSQSNPGICSPVTIMQGEGKSKGTWMHKDVALDFAQWLNPEFKVWCSTVIKQLINSPEGEQISKLKSRVSSLEKEIEKLTITSKIKAVAPDLLTVLKDLVEEAQSKSKGRKTTKLRKAEKLLQDINQI